MAGHFVQILVVLGALAAVGCAAKKVEVKFPFGHVLIQKKMGETDSASDATPNPDAQNSEAVESTSAPNSLLQRILSIFGSAKLVEDGSANKMVDIAFPGGSVRVARAAKMEDLEMAGSLVKALVVKKILKGGGKVKKVGKKVGKKTLLKKLKGH